MALVLERETFRVPKTFVEESDPYTDYLTGGGKLAQEYYEYIGDFVPDATTSQILSDRTYRSSWYQAEGMDKFTAVGLSDREIYLYMILRNLPLTPNPSDQDPGRRPQSLSDQVLMAEILRITDQEKFNIFAASYPVIFPTETAQIR